jgi:hypothetical protein
MLVRFPGSQTRPPGHASGHRLPPKKYWPALTPNRLLARACSYHRCRYHGVVLNQGSFSRGDIAKPSKRLHTVVQKGPACSEPILHSPPAAAHHSTKDGRPLRSPLGTPAPMSPHLAALKNGSLHLAPLAMGTSPAAGDGRQPCRWRWAPALPLAMGASPAAGDGHQHCLAQGIP